MPPAAEVPGPKPHTTREVSSVTCNGVKDIIIWGNHSSPQYPDVNHGKVKAFRKEDGISKALKVDSRFKGDSSRPCSSMALGSSGLKPIQCGVGCKGHL